MASWILRIVLFAVSGQWCVDANVPYRLIKTSVLTEIVNRIPSKFHLANVALSVLLKKNKKVTHSVIPIRFRERYGGEPSVKLKNFGSKALELIKQLKEIT
jgi:hypothetical protein